MSATTASTPLWVPIVVACIGVAGVLVATYAAVARDRAARRAEHESERLAELVDAALDLRDILYILQFDDAVRPTEPYARALALFVARRHAVRARRVRDLAGMWEESAFGWFSDVETSQVPEQAVWREFLVATGTARRAAS